MTWLEIKGLVGERSIERGGCWQDGDLMAFQVIDAFGGIPALRRALAHVGFSRNVATFYRWTYVKSKGGTNGRVPKHMIKPIYKAAAPRGIRL